MKRFCSLFLAAAFLLTPALSQAAQFAIVGPRALGMGGASVASVNDSTAVYWNPAALAQYHRVDIRIPVEAALRDHIGLKDTWSRINDIDALVQAGDPAAINEMYRLLLNIDQPNTGVDIDASTGLFISIPLPKSAVAVSALGFGYAGLYPTIDTLNLDTTFPPGANFIGNNNSSVTGIGIFAVEPALSFAAAPSEKFFIGVNAKMIYAKTYVSADNIRTIDFNTFKDNLDNSETKSSKASLDAGILFVPSESLSIGVVGRDLNSPSFPVQGRFAVKTSLAAPSDVYVQFLTKEIELKPQVRAGIAWKPFQTLTLSADYDLTKNKTLTPGYEDQTLAAGLEKTFLSEYFSIRLGAYKNMADSDANTVYTAGLGTRIFAFRLDLAAAYDYDEREGQASLNLALKF